MIRRLLAASTIGALGLLALSGCAGESALTFTKDANDTTPAVVSLSAIDMEEVSVAKGDVSVLGDDANAMELFEWFLAEQGVAFEQNNGMISTVADLEGDQNKGWMIYVNGETAAVGAAELIPEDGDSVELRYVDYATLR